MLTPFTVIILLTTNNKCYQAIFCIAHQNQLSRNSIHWTADHSFTQSQFTNIIKILTPSKPARGHSSDMNYRVPTAKVITKPWENLPTSYKIYWHYVLLKILCPYLLINTVEIFVDETMNCRLWSDSSHPKQCKLTVKTLNNMTLYVNVINRNAFANPC